MVRQLGAYTRTFNETWTPTGNQDNVYYSSANNTYGYLSQPETQIQVRNGEKKKEKKKEIETST